MLRLVLRQSLLVVLLGIGLGSVAAFAAGKWLGSLLFHTSPRDPMGLPPRGGHTSPRDPAVLAAVSTVLLLVALCRCLVPTLRAARVNPSEALRAE